MSIPKGARFRGKNSSKASDAPKGVSTKVASPAKAAEDTPSSEPDGTESAPVEAENPSPPESPDPVETAAPAAEVPDPIPDGIRALLELFKGPLSEVRFPDVDRSILEEAGEAVRSADAEVHRLFAELEAAQNRLSEKRNELTKLADRARSYARIYAAEDAGLVAQLEAIDLGPAKKAGRKPKAASNDPAKKRTAKVKAVPDLVVGGGDKLTA